jgi:tetratricopeptide (TPR) repeat protein
MESGNHTLAAYEARRWSIVPAVLGVALLLAWLFPYVFSAYHLEAGGRELDQATRSGISLDPSAPAKVRAHLETSLRWQPDNAQAYCLSSRAYFLEGQLTRAAEDLVQAAALRPKNLSAWWELSKVYGAMGQQLQAQPGISLMDLLDAAAVRSRQVQSDVAIDIDAENETAFHHTNLAEWQMPIAPGSQPDGLEVLSEPVQREVLVTQPGSQVGLTITVPLTATKLVFWMGADPAGLGRAESDTTFQLGVNNKQVFRRRFTAEDAQQGWWPGFVDLGAWAGKTLNVTLETDTSGKEAGWADVRLVGAQVADYAALAPDERLLHAWRTAGANAPRFAAQANRLFQKGEYEAALAWYERAGMMDSQQSPSVVFRAAVAASVSAHRLPRYLDTTTLAVHSLTQTIRIQAETLQWVLADSYWGIEYGDRLRDHPSGDLAVGVLWWQQKPAVAFVRVQREGLYRITIRAKHSILGPGQLQVDHNFTPLARFSIKPDWQVFETATHLARGIEIIAIQYTDLAEGMNGDAILDWMQIQQITG